MGALYDMVEEIDRLIHVGGLDPFATRGAIGMKAGLFLVAINKDTPDDPERIAALRKAAEEVLGRPLGR